MKGSVRRAPNRVLMKSLCSISRDADERCYSADDAESKIDKLGQELKLRVLEGWAKNCDAPCNSFTSAREGLTSEQLNFLSTMEKQPKAKLGSASVLKLLGRLSIYYLLFFAIIFSAMYLFPELKDWMPLGGASILMDPSAEASFENYSSFSHLSSSSTRNAITLFLAILGVTLVMLPVTWVYLKIRVVNKLDQSLVQTMMLLPVAVAGVVTIVQNSIALAFSLAGIVAGVRFRNTLKNTGDSLFIFIAIGAGLAAGVRALEIAIVVTVVYNIIFLILWDLDYGAENAQKYMRPSDLENEDPRP